MIGKGGGEIITCCCKDYCNPVLTFVYKMTTAVSLNGSQTSRIKHLHILYKRRD